MSWPRGSNISPVRIQSYSVMKRLRRSLALLAGRAGAPPATTRTGLPQVWASTQKKVWQAMAGLVGQSAGPINSRRQRRTVGQFEFDSRLDKDPAYRHGERTTVEP